MVTARLTGNIWATRKSDLLSGYKLLLAEVIGGTRAGESMVVIDTIGAGIGDRVIVACGSSARRMLGSDEIPADAAVVGIIDEDCAFEGFIRRIRRGCGKMKQLICAADIEALKQAGKTVCVTGPDVIVTPSAKDAAEALGITFSDKEPEKAACTCDGEGIDSEQIYQLLKALMDKGL